MTALKLTQIGNSVGVILPKEILARLKLEKGDTVFVTNAANGVMLTPYDPSSSERLEAGRNHAQDAILSVNWPSDWRWIDRRALDGARVSLSEHGGASGMRDEGLLESALARPLNLSPTARLIWPILPRAYGVGLAKNHPFVDGNKRAAFLAVGLFLSLNGWRLVASQADATLTMLAVAAGQMDETTFAGWLRRHSRPR